MKRFVTILLISVLLLSSLSAASFIDKTFTDMKQKENAAMGVSLSLSSLIATDIGFSSVPIESMTQKNEKPVVSKVLDTLDAATGTFSSGEQGEFYMYWKVLGNPSQLPNIFVKVSGPMESAVTNATVDWKASWADVSGGTYNESNVVFSGKTPEDSRKQVFPDATIQTTSNKLTSYCICKKVKIETLEPYWVDPAAAYSGKLWLEVQGL